MNQLSVVTVFNCFNKSHEDFFAAGAGEDLFEALIVAN